jgi:hypothetical protein
MSNLKVLSSAEKAVANLLFAKLKKPIKEDLESRPFDMKLNRVEEMKIIQSECDEQDLEFQQMFKQFINKFGIEKAKEVHKSLLAYTNKEFRKDIIELDVRAYNQVSCTTKLINIIENGKTQLQT